MAGRGLAAATGARASTQLEPPPTQKRHSFHVVGYRRIAATFLGRGASLLDSASYPSLLDSASLAGPRSCRSAVARALPERRRGSGCPDPKIPSPSRLDRPGPSRPGRLSVVSWRRFEGQPLCGRLRNQRLGESFVLSWIRTELGAELEDSQSCP